jgi:FMN phosphatase YigB (HAD superfamily)
MIRYLVIFDVDGTLVNLGHCIDFDALLVQAFETIPGIEVPSLADRDTLWRAGKDHEILLNGWGVTDVKKFWNIFDRLDFDARSTAITDGKIVPYLDAVPALAKLQASGQVAMAVHTNTPAKLALFQLEHFGMKKYFDHVLALDMAGYDQARAKPEPWGIHYLQDVLGTKHGIDFRSSTVFIGDSDEIDMLTAENAHVPGILVSRDAEKKPALHAFDHVPGLRKITPARIKTIIQRFLESTFA